MTCCLTSQHRCHVEGVTCSLSIELPQPAHTHAPQEQQKTEPETKFTHVIAKEAEYYLTGLK